ncbi:hypothetical protein M8C21_019466, partial [Ambrosia artemisiifolia]
RSTKMVVVWFQIQLRFRQWWWFWDGAWSAYGNAWFVVKIGQRRYMLSFSLGAGPVPSLLLPKIFFSRVRAKAVALSLTMRWQANGTSSRVMIHLIQGSRYHRKSVRVGGAATSRKFHCILSDAYCMTAAHLCAHYEGKKHLWVKQGEEDMACMDDEQNLDEKEDINNEDDL